MKNILTASQSRFNLILNVLAHLMSCCQCLAVSRVSSIWMMSRIVSSQPNSHHSGRIARSARCWYLSYSVSDFVFFPQKGDTLHRWGWNLTCQISPHWCNNDGIGPQNWKFYWTYNLHIQAETFFYTILVNIVFSNRVIDNSNQLLEDIVTCTPVNNFKNRLSRLMQKTGVFVWVYKRLSSPI